MWETKASLKRLIKELKEAVGAASILALEVQGLPLYDQSSVALIKRSYDLKDYFDKVKAKAEKVV